MPGRVKGAWNLISKLAIALIWKTPTRLKFRKTKICQEQNILTFVYNKTGADSSEWFEPAEDAKVSGQGTGQEKTSSKPKKTQPHRAVKTKKPAQAGPSKVQKTQKPKKTVVIGDVYIITMKRCLNQPEPPFGKVGSSKRTESNCQARLKELQTGNPHQLVCRHTFPVTENERTAEHTVKKQLRAEGLGIQPSCRGGSEWFSYPRGGLAALANRVTQILNDEGVLAPRSDWVESSINPSLSPNQSPQFLYNSKWRQVPCKGDELQHITYNCKWHFSEVTCVTIARSRKWSIKCRYSNKRRTFAEKNFISSALE